MTDERLCVYCGGDSQAAIRSFHRGIGAGYRWGKQDATMHTYRPNLTPADWEADQAYANFRYTGWLRKAGEL
jgi:hypothetical protein